MNSLPGFTSSLSISIFPTFTKQMMIVLPRQNIKWLISFILLSAVLAITPSEIQVIKTVGLTEQLRSSESQFDTHKYVGIHIYFFDFLMLIEGRV